ncbi:MAG: tetratricopeptide repeat protein [Candidatus Stygibacter frigidus]|nr:tetratricopeptide repeat protein [Candidatus Stygibacter frigidus]
MFFQLIAVAGEELTGMLMNLEEQSGSDPARALEIGGEALAIAREDEDTASEAKIVRLIADSYYYLNDLESALRWYEQAAELVKEQEGETSTAYGMRLGDVAYCQEYLLHFEDAIETYKVALAIAKEHESWQEIITISNNIGNIYYRQADYNKAMDYYQQTLKSEEEHGNEADLSLILNCIAMVHEAWNDYDDAVDYYKRALAIDRRFGNEERIAIRLNNLGFLYQGIDEYDKALEYLLEAMEIDTRLENRDRMMIRANNIASIYISKGNFAEAKKYLKLVEEDLDENTSPNLWATYYENYGNYYYNQGFYDSAEEYHHKSLELNKKYGMSSKRRSAYMDLAVLYKAKCDYKAAYEYLEKYRLLNDSLFTSEKHKQIRELELKYETEKKENQINLLQKNAEIKDLQLQSQARIRNLLILILVLVIIMVFLIFRSWRHKENVKRVLQAKKAMEQSRLAILGELIAGIVHEVNQPLQSISFSLENMQSAISEEYADKEYLNRKTGNMVEDVERMLRIINHIRTFTHNQADKKLGSFDLNESIHNALRMTEERLKKHRVKIEVDLHPDLPVVLGNVYSFEQVILILLSNANDAVEEKAIAAGKDYQKKVCLRTEKRGKEVVVLVGDNGGGIPDGIMDKIMKPFFTTKEEGKGTGLGLSIARGIINDMDGTIEIDSVADKGTIIKISFISRDIKK